MSRQKRFYLPGAAFHIASRTIGRSRWFTPSVRDYITDVIGESLLRSDAQLAAFAVMSNHFHLIVRQGDAPLSKLMHPICRRIAVYLQRLRGRKGYIFERRYRAFPIKHARHLRRAICYTHRNPVDGGLCSEAGEYPWSSHWSYAGGDLNHRSIPQLSPVLELFSSAPGRSGTELQADYRKYFDWCHECRRSPPNKPRPRGPNVAAGDVYWERIFRSTMPVCSSRLDLSNLAEQVVRELAPDLDLQYLLLRRGGRQVTRVRHEIIRRAVLSRYRNVKVADFLGISETTVSKVATQLLKEQRVRFDSWFLPNS